MSWRRFGEAARSGTRRSSGAAPGATLRARSPAWAERQPAPRPMELLLCLNRLAVSIIFFFVSSLPPPYWATKKREGGARAFRVFFSPLSLVPTHSRLWDSRGGKVWRGAAFARPTGSPQPSLGLFATSSCLLPLPSPPSSTLDH